MQLEYLVDNEVESILPTDEWIKGFADYYITATFERDLDYLSKGVSVDPESRTLVFWLKYSMGGSKIYVI